MPELSHIDPRSAALLVMDYQVDTLTRFMTAAQSADAIACVPRLIATARDVGMMVIHVVVAFRPDHPEVSPRNGIVTVIGSGMPSGGRPDWWDDVATRPQLPPSVPGRDHQPRRLAVPRVQPQSAGC
jgi:nicotinamidase-related amidase